MWDMLMKTTCISSVSIYVLFILFISIGYAANYSFTLDASPPADNVVEYKIYYRVSSATYNDSDFVAVSTTNPTNSRLTGT